MYKTNCKKMYNRFQTGWQQRHVSKRGHTFKVDASFKAAEHWHCTSPLKEWVMKMGDILEIYCVALARSSLQHKSWYITRSLSSEGLSRCLPFYKRMCDFYPTLSSAKHPLLWQAVASLKSILRSIVIMLLTLCITAGLQHVLDTWADTL